MTGTLLVALLALITTVFASVLLVPSGRSAEQTLLQVQWPGRQEPHPALFAISHHAITECGR